MAGLALNRSGDAARGPGSSVPRSSVLMAVWHFEYRHEFRHAAERTFTSYMSYGETNVLETRFID